MPVTMMRADGVTVLTLTSDPNSACPPLCQILCGLCYSPVLCSVSQGLRGLQGTSQAVLGALQIMAGVLNIGLGIIQLSCDVGTWYEMRDTWFPIWLGILFILFGLTSILSQKYPSPCLVMVNVILNLCGVAFAITGIVLYSINTAFRWDMWWSCDKNDDYDQYRYDRLTTTPTPDNHIVEERCLEATQLIEMFVRSINLLLLVLCVLELCLVISSVTLGIKALRRSAAKKSTEKPEMYRPLLEEGTPNLKV